MNNLNGLEIAVIGMSGRFPGASNLDKLWKNLCAGVESIKFFDTEELEALGRDSDSVKMSNFIPAHGVLDGFDLFDAGLFGFTPREAEVMDPQHRLFLEVAQEALETAGYNTKFYRGLIGVFAGASVDNYLYQNVYSNKSVMGKITDFQANSLNQSDFLSTRVSYKLNLEGPSFTILSACSTSLVAVHTACQQLISGTCDIALAGGVSLTLPHNWGYHYQDGMIFSPDGHCRAFDADARGCLKGDGVGVVVLKRLSDALEDGDSIDAVILGAAINNDGSGKVGYAAPGIDGQIDAIQSAYIAADVEPDTITYIEAHGTGTPVGDPIEVSALKHVFEEHTSRRGFCGLGSIKTNFGHLDAAAGVAGLIKTVLALKNKTLPPSLHYKTPNPQIDFDNSPFYVNTVCKAWEVGEYPRRAGVSSFGIGGTNVHVVLEEAPVEPIREKSLANDHLIVLSTRSENSLDHLTDNLSEHLKKNPSIDIADVARTFQVGRGAYDFRRAFVGHNVDNLIELLDNRKVSGNVKVEGHSFAFLFSGQGTQYVNMGRELYNTEPVFKEKVDECIQLLGNELGSKLFDILYYDDIGSIENASFELRQTNMAQVAIFVTEYALASLWMYFGVKPSAVLGHSVAEYAAACIAGVFSLKDALALVVLRGKLMQSMPGGCMLAVPSEPEVVLSYLGYELSLAAVNTPSLCVVSGSLQAIDAFESKITKELNVECRRLHTSHAFHSKMMEPIIRPFVTELEKCEFSIPKIPFISTVTGTWVESEITKPDYWIRNILQTVLFSDAIEKLLVKPNTGLIEIGAGKTLETLSKRNPKRRDDLMTFTSLRQFNEKIGDREFFLTTMGGLWAAGVDIDFENFTNDSRRIPLPTYPFEHKRYWVDPSSSEVSDEIPTARTNVDDWFYLPSWRRSELACRVKKEHVSKWLIFVDKLGLAEQLAQFLSKENNEVVLVRFGEEFISNNNSFIIDSANPDHFHLLLSALIEQNKMPENIIHMSAVTTSLNSDEFEHTKSHCFYSLLYLAQALAECDVSHTIKMMIVANDTQSVFGNEAINPEKILGLGFVRVLPTEHNNISCCYLDIDVHEPAKQSKNWLAKLVSEILLNSEQALVAYRNNYRWVYGVEPVIFESQKTSILSPGNVYLITGGLGGIGLEIARFFAKNCKAKLVLVGRSSFPSRSDWETWIEEYGKNDNTSIKIKRVMELESFGAEVLICKADVADKLAMEDVLRKTKNIFGSINGVVHAAGVSGGGIIALQNRERIENVFSAKVNGVLVLESLLENEKLDFMILCSSLTSAIGRQGRLEYTAANLFLDAMAHKKSGTPTVSINWDTWKNIGMSAESSPVDYGLSSNEGMEAFEKILGQSWAQIFVSTVDLKKAMKFYNVFSGNEDEITPINEENSLYSRSGIQTDYKVPESEREKKLANIWQDLLGIENIGINDNFFELGGDSIISIQIISRARQANINLLPRQVFECQTIAELAAAAKNITPSDGSEKNILVSGDVPLTPIQRWFFEEEFIKPHHWNMVKLLETPQHLDIEALSRALTSLMNHHDVLRMRFFTQDDSLCQYNGENIEKISLDVCDLSSVSDEMLSSEIEKNSNNIQESLTLDSVVKFIFFDFGKERSGRLLIVAHHLVIDVISFRILMEDIKTAYEQAVNGKLIKLPPKTTSFKSWAEGISEYKKSQQIFKQVDYWTEVLKTPISSIPRDFINGDNTVASVDVVSASLEVDFTKKLINKKVYGIQITEILLTALSEVFRRFGVTRMLVDMERHGREAINDNLDVSRTVGWFTSVYPFVLEHEPIEDSENALRSMQNRLNKIPNKGFDYAVLRYLDNVFGCSQKSLSKAEVVFLYMGQVDNIVSKDRNFGEAPESTGLIRAPEQKRTHVFEIAAKIEGGCLKFDLFYSSNLHKRSTIEKISSDFMEVLSYIGGYEEGKTISSENTFGFEKVELDKIMLSISQEDRFKIENISPLSPLQQLTLLASIASHSLEHVKMHLKGVMHTDILEQAWEYIIKRHSILRTGFLWEKIQNPVQVVFSDAKFLCEQHDWREMSGETCKQSIEEYLKSDLKRGFELNKAPVMRLACIRLHDDEVLLVWSYNQIIADGWSVAIIFRELFDCYNSLSRRCHITPKKSPPYCDYVAWLDKQNISDAEIFWKGQLEGISKPTPIWVENIYTGVSNEKAAVECILTNDELLSIRTLSKSFHVTLNTLVQGAWALLLAKYSAEEDILFGSVFSGRPGTLDGVEDIVGSFTNNLPVRVYLGNNEAFSACLKKLQNTLLAIREYEYVSPTQMQSWTDIPSRLFETLVLYQNFPLEGVFEENKYDFHVEKIKKEIKTSFPLSLVCVPALDMTFQLVYSVELWNASMAEKILSDLMILLRAIIANPKALNIELKALLSLPDTGHLHNKLSSCAVSMADFVAPVTDMESIVANVWQYVLGLEKVGVCDNFFALGGRSIQIMRIYEHFKKLGNDTLSIVELFEFPTVREFAKRLENGRNTSATLKKTEDKAKERKEKSRKRRQHLKNMRIN